MQLSFGLRSERPDRALTYREQGLTKGLTKQGRGRQMLPPNQLLGCNWRNQCRVNLAAEALLMTLFVQL